MPAAVTRLRIFVASPNDVAEERNRLESVVRELNATLGSHEDLVLELVRWETHAWPGFGRDAQAVINAEIEPYDIFVGVMWARVGTPTGRSLSGTVEEFEQAYRLWQTYRRPTIMFYFNTAIPERADAGQMHAVAAFKTRVAQMGALYWQYWGPDQFEAQVRQHLYRQVLALTQKGPSPDAVAPSENRLSAAPRLEDGSIGVQTKLSQASVLALGEGVVAVANAQTQIRPPGAWHKPSEWHVAGVSAATLIVLTNARVIWWFVASHGQGQDPQIAWWLTYEQIESVRLRSIPIDPYRPKLTVRHKLPLERRSILSWLLRPAAAGEVMEQYVRSHIGGSENT